MNRPNPHSATVIELLPGWEGPAEHAPGVLFEPPSENEPLKDSITLQDLADWICATGFSGFPGHPTTEALRARVVRVLGLLCRTRGQAQLQELQQLVTTEMMKHQPRGKLTAKELKHRIDTLFGRVEREAS